MKQAMWVSLLIFCLAPVVCAQSESNKPAGKKIAARELEDLISNRSTISIVDVRLPKHYDASQTKIKGAVRIAPKDLKWRLGEIPRDKQVVLYCACPDDATGLRLAAQLIENGYKDVSVLKGGWDGWVQAGGPQEPK